MRLFRWPSWLIAAVLFGSACMEDHSVSCSLSTPCEHDADCPNNEVCQYEVGMDPECVSAHICHEAADCGGAGWACVSRGPSPARHPFETIDPARSVCECTGDCDGTTTTWTTSSGTGGSGGAGGSTSWGGGGHGGGVGGYGNGGYGGGVGGGAEGGGR